MNFIIRIANFATKSENELGFDIVFELGNRHADLLHSVAVAHGNAFILERIEVHGNADRRDDFVLTAVALADLTRFVVFYVEMLAEFGVNFVGGFGELFRKRQDRGFDGRNGGVEVHNGADVVLLGVDHLFFVSVAK